MFWKTNTYDLVIAHFRFMNSKTISYAQVIFKIWMFKYVDKLLNL